MRNTRHNGRLGERKARELLNFKGYQIEETNWRYKRAEIDIIAKRNNVLVIVEVKMRKYKSFEPIESLISEAQQSRLMDAAMAYCHQTGHDNEVRFDVIAVYSRLEGGFTVKHHEDAFFPDLEVE